MKKPKDKSKKLIEGLRKGKPLTSESIGAIVDGISNRLDEIAMLWGEMYGTAAKVALPARGYSLHFKSNNKNKWQFRIIGDEGRGGFGNLVRDCSLKFKMMAVEALPKLKAALEDAKEVDKDSLLRALDTLEKIEKEIQ